MLHMCIELMGVACITVAERAIQMMMQVVLLPIYLWELSLKPMCYVGSNITLRVAHLVEISNSHGRITKERRYFLIDSLWEVRHVTHKEMSSKTLLGVLVKEDAMSSERELYEAHCLR